MMKTYDLRTPKHMQLCGLLIFREQQTHKWKKSVIYMNNTDLDTVQILKKRMWNSKYLVVILSLKDKQIKDLSIKSVIMPLMSTFFFSYFGFYIYPPPLFKQARKNKQ